MTYSPLLNTAPTDLEHRMGIPSLEVLHAERREIQKKLVPLKYLFGSGGDREEAERKRHRNLIERLLREELPDGKDIAQGRIESMANSDPRHLQFCEDMKDRFIQYEHWNTCHQEIEEMIAAREYESRFHTAELRLAQ